MLQVNVEARYTAQDILSHPWVTDDNMENNMKMEVSGKLRTHFNTAPKPSTTTAGVSVIMWDTTASFYLDLGNQVSSGLWLTNGMN
ncbi:serine/threonine-protein kinase DCLK1-like isoform X3 [Salvelinus sp. IW2-2015]|uniref:serine/threonine-protein kinase DCLK1-like isoform X3 n=1 Tax=Salvelinus sp. IW2-2015 TaxID=2691554 RepID=UPI0038D4D9BF